VAYRGSSRAGARLRWAGLFGLIAALCICLMPGVAEAKKGKKKKDQVKVLSYNVYLGSETDRARDIALCGAPGCEPGEGSPRTDAFADEVGQVLRNVEANNFPVRARTIAKQIKKNKADLVGLQEASLWKLEIPTDGGGPPRGSAANVVLIDYIDALVDRLNKGARTKTQCGRIAKKREAQGKKPKPCYRGYKLVVAQQEAVLEFPGDFDNDPGPNGKTFDVSSTDSLEDFGRWLEGNDDTPGVNFGEPPSPFPTDANFDTSPTGNTPDPGGGTDCEAPVGQQAPIDTNPAAGPAFGEDVDPGPGVNPWPFEGYDGDVDPVTPGAQMPVCLFHGIDGDIRLEQRDALLARKGAGVKTRNVTAGNFSPGNTLTFEVLGLPVPTTRGWVQADASVRGKKFRLVSTHLEDEDNGTIREDQAAELVAPGGPATAPKTVLIGDLNSDPSVAPGADPEEDGLSNVAYNRLVAAGFRSLTGPAPTFGHGELLNDLGNLIDNDVVPADPLDDPVRIDHILTNSSSIGLASSVRLDPLGGGLWASDHAGLLSRLRVPGGKKK
jgi:endonuclease/exonuclease/phosphatase family metal-dependent hydrolase